ncbi:MAG: creatininase family protein [Proteobacteria bacterium]|nr:creatininase family protein [Pseudomonadota bacterium]
MTSIWNTETCYEIDDRKPRFAVIPIGSFEQHGRHLPVTTDTLVAAVLSKAVCDAYSGLLISPITISCSHEHVGFPASFSISAETLARVLKDLIGSIQAQGIAFAVIVNGHGGNYIVGNVAQELNMLGPRVFVCPTRQHWQVAMKYAGVEKSISEDMHGGEVETSILLHAMPEVVRMDKIEDCEATERPLLTLHGIRRYTQSGIIGFPSKATPKKGQLLLEKMTEVIGMDIEDLLAGR